MKKQTTYTIIAILLLTIIIIGSTYAFFTATAGDEDSVNTNSTKLEVIYTGDTSINDNINIGSKKEDGLSRTVNIAVSEDSVEAKGTIYINIEEISENLRIKGFIWEVYGVQNGKEVYSNRGDFEGTNDTTNNVIEIVKDYKITKDNTEFTAYFWIDGNQTDNSVIGGSFKGYIGAKTENFTGEL